jgi:GDSL-like Lipase/Acylhydrolase family
MKLSRRIAVAALAALAGAAGVAGGAMLSPGGLGPGRQAQIGPPKPTVPSPGPVYRGPAATLRWSVPERYAKGWDAWLTHDATYSRAYVSPDAWSVTVDACGSQGGSDRITRYEVEITGVGFHFKTTWGGPSCRRRFDDLPRLAQYDVALTVRTKRDSDRTVERITLRDWLIVSLGDSMASGEGSPDQTGWYRLLNKVTSDADVLKFLLLLSLGHPRPASDPDFKVRELRPVRWKDKRCHRSARAGHARAAAEIERLDPHSSVTFLSLACSGAEIKHLVDTRYSGQQPSDDPQPATLPPQISELRRLVPNRRVDALLLSIGINDLDFSGIIQACATNPATPHYGDDACVYDTGVDRKLNELSLSYLDGPSKYDRLAGALRSVDIAETYLTDYPAVPFGTSGTGCGMLGLRLVGIGTEESAAMYRTGQSLNLAIQNAANRNGWNYVDGMTDAFRGRDYCEPFDERNSIRLEQSLDHQGTEHGTSHPNPRGHQVLGNLLTRWVALGRPAYPFVRLKVIFDAVKMGKSFHDRLDDYLVSVHDSPQKTTDYRRGVGYMGRWMGSSLEFSVDVYDPPRPPRFATKLSFDIRPVNFCCSPHGAVYIHVNFGRSDLWGVGSHEVATTPTAEYPDGFLHVRYHVVGERILDPAGTTAPVFAR